MVIGCNCRSGWLEVVIAFKSVNAHNTNSPRRGKIIQGKEIINDTKFFLKKTNTISTQKSPPPQKAKNEKLSL